MRTRTFREEVGIPVNQLAAHGGSSKFPQRLSLVVLACVDSNLLDLVYCHDARPPQTFDDDLAADSGLDVFLDLLQDLASEHHY